VATRKKPAPRPTRAQVQRLRQTLERIERAHREMYLHLRAVRRQIEGPFMFMA
jgi:hypothetical protein